MKILVCGGRDFQDKEFFYQTMDSLIYEYYHFKPRWEGEPELISGMANGADSLALEYGHTLGYAVHEFPANWTKHGKDAGPIRNQQMLDEGKPDLVVAFPGGRGTADMVRRAQKAGVEVREIVYPS